MGCYAGIDVSLEPGNVCVVDASGKIVHEIEALPQHFAELGLPIIRVRLDTVLLETRHVKAALSAMTV